MAENENEVQNIMAANGNNEQGEVTAANESQSDFLQLLPTQFQYTFREFSKLGTGFHATLDIQMSNICDVDIWKAEFEMKTKTTYTTRAVKKTLGKEYALIKKFICHHNTRGQSSNVNNVNNKNTNCPSQLTLKLKRKKPLCEHHVCCATVDYNHNHQINCADALRFRKPSLDVKRKFLDLFQSGHSPSSAIHANLVDLTLSHPVGYEELLSDRSVHPDYQWVARLFSKSFKSQYSTYEGKDSLKFIREKFEASIAKNGGCISTKEIGQEFVIVIITPLMRRVIESKSAGEIVLVDSSGGVDKESTRMFILITHSCIGGLPIGIILTSSESGQVLREGFELFKDCQTDKAFGGQGHDGPKIFLTDDCAAERKALHSVWPNTTMLLCIFHVLQALWRWLFDAKHGILLHDRQVLLNLFKDILYAKTEEDADDKFGTLMNNDVAKCYPSYLGHIKQLHMRKNEWALFSRANLITRGNNTNNIAEASFRIMKDVILGRTKAFSIVQLVDFIVQRLELYYEQRLLSASYNRLSQTLFLKLKSVKSSLKLEDIRKIDDEEFEVKSELNDGKLYRVNVKVGTCTCIAGASGRLCKHQGAVLQNFNIEEHHMLNISSPVQRQNLYFLATGIHKTEDFFQPLYKESVVTNASNDLQPMLSEPDENLSCTEHFPQISTSVASMDTMEEVNKEAISTNIKSIFEDLSRNLNEKPELYGSALQAFYKSYMGLKTDSAKVSALHQFAKESNVRFKKSSVLAIKRSGPKISVQPTAISRQVKATGIASGTRMGNVGRPLGTKRALRDHVYTSRGKRNLAAPHNLNKCVDANRSLGSKRPKK